MQRLTLIAAALLFAAIAQPTSRADEALDLAKKLTTEGAAIFSSKNATAMMETYVDDCRVEIISRDASTGEVRRDVHSGKGEVRKLYEDLFKAEGSVDARNIVNHARLIGGQFLLITGTFEVSHGGKSSAYPFVQLRVKDGDNWRLTSVQIIFAGN